MASRMLLAAALVLCAALRGAYAIQYMSLMDALDTEHATYFKQVAISGGFGSMLRDTEWQGTAFLPTNEGFDFLLFYLEKASLAELLKDGELCRDIASYHIIPHDKVTLDQIPAPNTGSLAKWTMYDDDALLLTKRSPAAGQEKPTQYVKGYVNGATVLRAKKDMRTPAGIVHFIDSALIPYVSTGPLPPRHAPAATVASLVSSVPVLSDAWELIQRAGLKDYFASANLKVTIFVPDNEAMLKLLKRLGYKDFQQLWAKGQGYLHGLVADMTVADRIKEEDLVDLATFPTMGSYSAIIYSQEGLVSVGSPRSVATIVSPALYVDPSVVYIVDQVLLEKASEAA